MNPPKGYYRQLLNEFPEVRIAFTHTPIIGCKIINSKPFIEVLEKSTDPHSKFYSEGLKNGSLVTIVESYVEKIYRNNGELFFTT
jgi:hypothetical protein